VEDPAAATATPGRATRNRVYWVKPLLPPSWSQERIRQGTEILTKRPA